MNLMSKFKDSAIDIYEYTAEKGKEMFKGEQISKNILEGPYKILMEKINQFNNDYIRTRYMNRNRSMLEPLDDIGLTEKLSWKRGVTKTLEKLFVERILQFNKGGSVGLKFVRRPESSQHMADRARNDLRGIDNSLTRVKEHKGAWNDDKSREKIESFMDLALSVFFDNIDGAIEYFKSIKSMKMKTYVVNLRTGNKENMVETPTGYRTGKYWSALDVYSALHREFIVAIHIENPSVKYFNREGDHVANIDSQPVTLLFRYHMSSIVQAWVNRYYNMYKEDGSNNERIKDEMLSSSMSLPSMLMGEPSVLWEGAMNSSNTEDEINSYYGNRRCVDISSIYHNYTDTTLYPYVGTNESGNSKWTSLSNKGFMAKLFKDIGLDYRKASDLVLKKENFGSTRNRYRYEQQAINELPRNQCFGDLNSDIQYTAQSGNFIGMVPLLVKWQHYIQGRSNPLNGLNNLPYMVGSDWDSEMIRKVVGSVDIMHKNHLLKNGLCYQLNSGVYYNDFIRNEMPMNDIVDMLNFRTNNSSPEDPMLLWDARDSLRMIENSYKKYATGQCDTRIGGHMFSYNVTREYRYNNEPVYAENVKTFTTSENFEEVFITELCLEMLDSKYFERKREKYREWQNKLYDEIVSNYPEYTEEAQYKEFFTQVRIRMNPSIKPICERFSNLALGSITDYYNSCKLTLDTIHEEGIVTEDQTGSYVSINKFHDENYEKYSSFELFMKEVFDKYVYCEYVDENTEYIQSEVSDILDSIVESVPLTEVTAQFDNQTEPESASFDFSTEEGRLQWIQHIRNRRNR